MVAVLALLAAGAAHADCPPTALDLRGPWGQAHFSVEVADTADSRAQGLMFREHMASSAGMLFVYESPRAASFWMQNTLIPLDMIFADSTGTVTRIHANAIPHDKTPIDGGDGVAVVLEINGGMAAKLGITEGSEMRHPALDPALAVWPCSAP